MSQPASLADKIAHMNTESQEELALLEDAFEDEDGMQVDPAVTPAPFEPPRGLPADATADAEDEEEEDEPSPAFNIHSATFESQKFDEDDDPAERLESHGELLPPASAGAPLLNANMKV